MSTAKTERRNISLNRRAKHEYELSDHVEAGLLLLGSEVKSLRAGKASLEEAYVAFDNRGRALLMNAHVAPYEQANRMNHDPLRPRPLLLHATESKKLRAKVREKGLTIVPVQLYFQGPWAKLEIAVGRGRKLHDKRQAAREADDKREIARAMRGR